MGVEVMVQETLQRLPKELRRIVGNSSLTRNTVGWSNSDVFYLEDLHSYLKVSPYNELEPLEYEVAVLKWLHGKLPVPEVRYYEKTQGREYLLMSEIEGVDCSNSVHHTNKEGVVRNLAAGLRQIHSLDISECPFDQTLTIKLEKARLKMERGLVDEDDFEPQYQGKTARELYELLLETKPADEDLVFTHGDYCLPNIILNNNKVSGFIDLGRAGVADRYRDLALAVRSILYNLGSEQWVDLFFECYGITDRDQTKIDFYILLDEFY